MDHIQSQFYPVHILINYFSKSNFNIVAPLIFNSLKWSLPFKLFTTTAAAAATTTTKTTNFVYISFFAQP
jgi:hypothetical protein